MKFKFDRLKIIWLIVGFIAATLFLLLSSYSLVVTSRTNFCISCHEMRFVAEQGWMYSTHYNNKSGVVAGCSDCHIPPGPFEYIWTKTRDGITDIVVHTFGENNPEKMDWERLKGVARHHMSDSSCLRCHKNLTPVGASIKTLEAHREYIRFKNKKCIECHNKEFHGRFKEMLNKNNVSDASEVQR